MTIGLLVITDGRAEYLEQMWASLDPHSLDLGPFVLVDDSGDPDYNKQVEDWLKPDHFVAHPHRRGLAAAVESGWERMRRLHVDYVFHVEEDFTFPQPPAIKDMVELLEADPWLAQVCLIRQPWSPIEQQFGTLLMRPELYEQRDGWIEHCAVFSLNPCVYPARVMFGGWPAENEAGMTQRLAAEGYHFGYLGEIDDPPRCIHIGARRSAGWSV